MAYGDSRSSVVTDTFDASISANWSNGEGDFDTCTWAAGGVVGPTSAAVNSAMRYNATTPNNNQYARLTVSALSASSFNVEGPRARCATGTDESSYLGLVASTAGLGGKYEIAELDAAAAYTALASGGTPGALASGDIITIEVEGTTIRLGTVESGGADTQRLTTTDNTIASGSWGLFQYADTTMSQCRLTAMEGGNIVAAGAYTRTPLRSAIFNSRVVQ